MIDVLVRLCVKSALRTSIQTEGNPISSLFSNKIFVRLASALVMAPISLLCVYLGGLYFFGFILFAYAVCLYEWQRMSMRTSKKWLMLFAGYVYFTLCYGLFINVRLEDSGFQLIVFLFVCVWSCDIGAFFTGKFFGGPKCVPKISPNKTWSGVFGGAALSVLLGHLFAYLFLSEHYNVFYVTQISIVIAFAAMLGDLVISYAKRLADIKDTGSIIPGHGGVLDRIDSLILASVPMAIFAYWGLL